MSAVGVQICALGPLELHAPGGEVRLGERQRALLAVLVVHAGETVSRDRLIDGMWADPPESAAAALQVHVSRLRRALSEAGWPEGVLVTRQGGYALDVPPGGLDVDDFEERVAEGRRELTAGRLDEAVAALDEALGRWRGRPLGDLADEPFALAWTSRLEELHRRARCDRVDAALAQGRHLDVLAELEAMSVAHALDERICGQLMTALYRSGRQADALRTYEALRRALAAELGIEPGAELRRLEQAVLEHDLAPTPPRRSSPAAAPIPATPTDLFVGRRHELELLARALHQSAGGHPSLVLVTGEPGAGKTRLAEEFSAAAAADRARVLWGRCLEGGGGTPFWPWAQVLRAYLAVASPDEAHVVIGPRRAALAAVLPELSDTAALTSVADPEAARLRVFDHMATAVAAASVRGSVVIVLDDLQWADPGSLLLLEFLMGALRGASVLVLAICRDHDAERGRPLASTLGALARGRMQRIALGGLAEDDIADYLARAVGTSSASIAGTVCQRTGGNAFFVREVVSLLAREGGFDPASAVAALAERIPAGVRDVVRRRCMTLDDDANRVLTLASVIGTTARLDVLQRACAGLDLVEPIETLLATGLLREGEANIASTAEVRFAHDLVRETVYADLSLLRRAGLHAAVADALEALLSRADPPALGEVARHLRLGLPAGVDRSRAVRYSIEAARAATAALAYEDAVAHYQRAVATLGDADPVERCELLLELGDAHWRTGQSDRAREVFVEAADLARVSGHPALVGRAVLGLGGGLFRDWHTSRGEGREKLVLLLEEALEGIGDSDEALRARLLGHLAEELYYVSPADRRERLSAEAVEVAERFGDAQVLASALCSRWLAVWSPGHLQERLELAERIVDLGVRLDDSDLWMFGQHCLVLARWETGDGDGAARALDDYERRAEASGQPLPAWRALVLRAHEALLTGRFGEAEQLAARALHLGEASHEPDAFNIYAVQLGVARMEADRLEENRTLLAALIEQLPETPWWQAALAFVDAETGRLDDARARFDQLAARDFASLPSDFVWCVGMALLTHVAQALGDRERARVLHRLLEPYAATNAMAASRASWGSVALYLGILAATAGDDDRADRWYRMALDANGAMGAAPWCAYTQYHHARLLLSGGAAASRVEGERLLDDAEATATRLGMTRLLRLIGQARHAVA